MFNSLSIKRLLLVFSVAAFSHVVYAQEEADIAAGKQHYETNCLSCHGVNGGSLVPTQPILAGQHAGYLSAQLKLFRSGERKDNLMLPFSVNLSDADIANLAAYMTAQTPVIAGSADVEAASRAEKLYRGGDIARGIPACTACHGPTGAGISPLYPRLSGQYAAYTASSLRAYASGERQADAMGVIAGRLTEQEIDDLAAYISGLSH